MGKVELFSIVLLKANPVYFSGETIFGKIDCRVKERIHIRNVRLDIKGSGKVHWIGLAGRGRGRHLKYYHASEEYFKMCIPFLNADSYDGLYLEAGGYTFPFEIELPLMLPASFECSNGKIRYSLTGTITTIGGANKSMKKLITVINHIDLNQYPLIRQPSHTRGVKHICCCCCSSGPIEVTLSLPKTGYVCGEFLSATITVNNQSSRVVKPLTICLIEGVQLNTVKKFKTYSREVCSYTLLKKTKAHSVERFENVGFVIPSVCATSISAFRLIEVDYIFCLKIDVARSWSKEIVVPILIGTIPLVEDTFLSSHNEPPTHLFSSSNQCHHQPHYFNTSPEPNFAIENCQTLESDAFIPQNPYHQYQESSRYYHDTRV